MRPVQAPMSIIQFSFIDENKALEFFCDIILDNEGETNDSCNIPWLRPIFSSWYRIFLGKLERGIRKKPIRKKEGGKKNHKFLFVTNKILQFISLQMYLLHKFIFFFFFLRKEIREEEKVKRKRKNLQVFPVEQ